MKREEKSFVTIQPAERQTTKAKAPTIEDASYGQNTNIVAKLRRKSKWGERNCSFPTAERYSKHQKLALAYRKWCRCRYSRESAFSARSNFYQFRNIQVCDQYTTETLLGVQRNDDFQTVDHCATCARNRKSLKRKKISNLVPAWGLIEFIALNIYGPLLQKENQNVLVITMMERYYRRTRVAFTSKTMVGHVGDPLVSY